MKKRFLLPVLLILASCQHAEYSKRIGTECDFVDHLKVTLTKVEEKDSIRVKGSNDSEELSTLEKNGYHYVCCSFDFKCDNATDANYTFNSEANFKLKDHPGLAAPIGRTFLTQNAVKDYSWIGLGIKTSELLSFEVAFEISTKFSPATTDMYVEVDLSNDSDGIDILLKE